MRFSIILPCKNADIYNHGEKDTSERLLFFAVGWFDWLWTLCDVSVWWAVLLKVTKEGQAVLIESSL